MQIHYAYIGKGEYDFFPQFKVIAPILQKADCTIGNLETTISNASIGYYGYPLFRTPGAYVAALKRAGFDILTTINNHSLDGGSFGIDNTLNVIKSYRLAHTGTFYAYEEPITPLQYNVNGINFAIIAFTHSLNCNEWFIPKEELPNRYILIQDKKRVKLMVERAKALNPDFIIACVHWGEEYFLQPNNEQKEQAKFLAHLGVDIILGSHPHVPQPLELITLTDKNGIKKNVPVIYSLSNFVANMGHNNHPHSDIGIILNLNFAPRGEGDDKDDSNNVDNSEETTNYFYSLGSGNFYLKSITYQPTWIHIFDYNNNHEKRCKKGFEVVPLLEDYSHLEVEHTPFSANAITRYNQAYKDVTTHLNREFFMPVKYQRDSGNIVEEPN